VGAEIARHSLIWGLRCQALIFNNSIFLPFFLILLFGPGRSHPSVPTRGDLMAAAHRDESRMAVAQVVQPRVGISRPLLDGPEHGGRLGASGSNASMISLCSRPSYPAQHTRRSPLLVALSLPHPYMRWDPTADPYHDAIYAIGSEAPKQRCPFLYPA